MSKTTIGGLESYRRRVSAQKRKDIIGAAMCEFGLKGYEKGAMAEIARQADVSTATLYKHFGSKELLFNAATDAMTHHEGDLGSNIFVCRAAYLSMQEFEKHGSPAVKAGLAVMRDFIKAMQNALVEQKKKEKTNQRSAA